MIHGVNHVGLTVSDLDESLRFYCEIAGLQLQRRGYRTGGDWFDTLTRNTGAEIDAVMVGADGFTLQLVQYYAGGTGKAVTGHSKVGNMHLCIEVGDVRERHRAIVETGMWNPTPIVEIGQSGYLSFYVEDPDGVPVEFLQRQADP